MNRLLRRFIPSLDEHLSDDRMASLFCHELPFAERLIARQHLANCWHCRVRQADLEGWRADGIIDFYRDAMEHEDLSLTAKPRMEFVQRLHAEVESTAPHRWWRIRLPQIFLPEFSSMDLTLATFILLGTATVISFFVWWGQRLPDISSNTLLVRAQRWDTPNLVPANGVVFQSIRITTPQQTIERSIYRDLQKKRQSRRITLVKKEEQLKSTLTQAGLVWDEPISASSYQGWHDSQHVREDKIVRAGKHLLTLTTKVPDGSISEQSLTVRDTDFHPVRRTIAFRNSGTIEIAELDFKILPWTAVDPSVFEPADNRLPAAATSTTRILQFPHIPESPSSNQVDETELGARIILNQLHADTGEQIEIERSAQGVEVLGLVETEERKQILQMQLRTLPHLKVSIQSLADLKKNPGAEGGTSSIETASMPDEPSPLETYLLAHNRNVSAVNVLAQQLFANALTISQESKSIDDLENRFVYEEKKTIVASAMLWDLIYSHRERLQAALKQERILLAGARADSETLSVVPTPAAAPLPDPPSRSDAAARNLALCKELTQTNGPATRSGDEILADMSVSIDDLSADMHRAHVKQQSESALGRKK